MTSGDVEGNKAVVRRYFEEVWNRGNMAVIDETFAPDYVRHDAGGDQAGLELQRRGTSAVRAAFPDLRMAIDLIAGEGDLVMARWTIRGTNTGPIFGHPPTGRPVVFSGVNIFRFQHHRCVEIWNHRDDAVMLAQLGISPPSPPAPPAR